MQCKHEQKPVVLAQSVIEAVCFAHSRAKEVKVTHPLTPPLPSPTSLGMNNVTSLLFFRLQWVLSMECTFFLHFEVVGYTA